MFWEENSNTSKTKTKTNSDKIRFLVFIKINMLKVKLVSYKNMSLCNKSTLFVQ